MASADLDQLSEKFAITVNPLEHEAERLSRLRREEADATHARWKNTGAFAVALAGIAAVSWICLECARNPASSSEAQKWAMAVLTTMVSGGLGFLFGRKTT